MSTQTDVALGEIDSASKRALPASRDRGFYFGMAAAMSVAVFLGFGPSFYLNGYLAERLGLQPLQALSRVIVVHGLVFTTWMIVLMVQTGLVAKGRIRWHQRLGVAGAVLAALVFTLGMAANIASSHRAVISGDFDRLPFIPFVVFGGFVSLIVFAVLVTLAIQWRRRPETHKRLMLLATIALLGAATARIAAYLGDRRACHRSAAVSRLAPHRCVSNRIGRTRLARGQTVASRNAVRGSERSADAGSQQQSAAE